MDSPLFVSDQRTKAPGINMEKGEANRDPVGDTGREPQQAPFIYFWGLWEMTGDVFHDPSVPQVRSYYLGQLIVYIPPLEKGGGGIGKLGKSP